MNTSTASSRATAASGGLRSAMRQYPLLFYVIIAYAFSWIVSIPFILAEWGIVPKAGFYQIFFIVKSFGPAVAAYIMVRATGGKAGLLDLRSRLRRWRVGWQWYAFILLGVPALMLPGIVVLPGALASFRGLPPHFLISYAVTFVVISLGGGPLGEEPGWRGFALPRLQQRYGPLVGSLVLGLLWSLWHLPLILTPGNTTWTGSLALFVALGIALAIAHTWVSNGTRASLLAVMLLHAAINTSTRLILPNVPGLSREDGNLLLVLAYGAAALLLVALTRGRLADRAADAD